MKPSDELLNQLRKQTKVAAGEPVEETDYNPKYGINAEPVREDWPTKGHWFVLGFIGILVVITCVIVA